MLYECHGHIMLDGADFRLARARHSAGVDEAAVRSALADLKARGVGYFRDGGDPFGVSLRAREMAPAYGIELVSPAFAIHRKGYYGAILGRDFSTMAEYRTLVAQAKAQHCDFLKLVFSGIITFKAYGELSCPGLPAAEIRELVHIAHGEGLSVMAHVNGRDTVLAAAAAGTDSIEHGYFSDGDCLQAMAENGSIWVPTLAAVAAFLGRADFDGTVVAETLEQQTEAIRRGAALGIPIASGSDSGAAGVFHGAGAAAELSLLTAAGAEPADIASANENLRRKFRRNERNGSA